MSRRIFSLADAQALLPTVKRLTAEAARRADELAAALQVLAETDSEHARRSDELNDVTNDWASQVRRLDLEVKGLWLVDFDTGHGCCCWCYPEETIGHDHGDDEGFAGRMKVQ